MEPYIKLSKNIKVKKEDMIPINENAFMYRKTKNAELLPLLQTQNLEIRVS